MEPTGIYVDYELAPNANIAAEARFGLVRYRARPKDSTCHHPSVDFGRPERSDGVVHVDCVCVGCGLSWLQTKVQSRTIADAARKENG